MSGKGTREISVFVDESGSFVPNVTPEKYKLFQVADMIATLELVRLKLETEGRISDAEKEFFLSIQNLKKNFLKPTARKRHE